MTSLKPFVSILTPTYNRRKFISQYLKYIRQQDYSGRIEVLVADDGTDPVEDLLILDNRFRYFRFNEKKTLGFKRNLLAQEAKGDVLINMDDDDYYPSTRISHAVNQLLLSDKLIAGCSHAYVLNALFEQLYEVGPFGENHATAGTLAYVKEYIKNHSFDDDLSIGEEPSFTNNFTEPMIQLNPLKTILVIQHQQNTWDKSRSSKRPTKYKLKDFIKSNDNRRFYRSLAIKNNINEY